MKKKKLRFDGAGYHITKKGYPRFNMCGKFKGAYVHRHVAAKMMKRPLEKDEDVHHKDGNKLNFKRSNLQVMGHREHGCVSAKQRWYLKEHDIKLEEEFYGYFEAGENGRDDGEIHHGEGDDHKNARGASVGGI